MGKNLKVWIDGASRGNPGSSGAGIYIENTRGEEIQKCSYYLGEEFTNNQAEYLALVKAFELCKGRDAERLSIKSDSQLLVRQMKGKYRVNSENLRSIYEKAKKLESEFDFVRYKHIPRENNSIADSLANEAIDEEHSS